LKGGAKDQRKVASSVPRWKEKCWRKSILAYLSVAGWGQGISSFVFQRGVAAGTFLPTLPSSSLLIRKKIKASSSVEIAEIIKIMKSVQPGKYFLAELDYRMKKKGLYLKSGGEAMSVYIGESFVIKILESKKKKFYQLALDKFGEFLAHTEIIELSPNYTAIVQEKLIDLRDALRKKEFDKLPSREEVLKRFLNSFRGIVGRGYISFDMLRPFNWGITEKGEVKIFDIGSYRKPDEKEIKRWFKDMKDWIKRYSCIRDKG